MSDTEHRERIAQNYQAVLEDVALATKQGGRQSHDVKIIGVTKYVDAATTAALVHAGCHSLGENRPQVLWQKAESDELASQAIDWHMIGHVQRNKLRRMMRYQPMIHSVDSQRLFDAIGGEAALANQKMKVLLEINISGDDSKTGLSVEALRDLLQNEPHPQVSICGLMAMAGLGSDQSTAREQFAKVRRLRDQLAAESGNPLEELSMGMSGDFAEAIAEGATMVRIGSRLFEGVL